MGRQPAAARATEDFVDIALAEALTPVLRDLENSGSVIRRPRHSMVQLRLCRAEDHADCGVKGLVGGGGRAKAVGIISGIRGGDQRASGAR